MPNHFAVGLLGILHVLIFAHFAGAQSLPSDEKIEGKPGLSTYQLKCREEEKDFYVYLPKSYDGVKKLPLVVSSHGHGGNGRGEIDQWIPFADQNGWIIACPTFLACSGKSSQHDELPMLEEVMKRLFRSLEIDKKNVLFTGFSAGGNVTWFQATQLDNYFTALCTRSGNFDDSAVNVDMKAWRNRPIYIYWGGNGSFSKADTTQGPAAVEYLEKKVHAHKVKFEAVPGGGHESRPELAAAWFLSLIQGPSS